jgi:hypothetical protein
MTNEGLFDTLHSIENLTLTWNGAQKNLSQAVCLNSDRHVYRLKQNKVHI